MFTNSYQRRFAALLLTAAVALPGCYDVQTLHQSPAEADDTAAMEEVDLGQFQITLPHVLGRGTDSIVEFHVFGYVASDDRTTVDRALATRGPELRWRMLRSVRELAGADFDEPRLANFRTAIAGVINAALEKPLVKQIGFYQFSFDTI